MHFLFGRRKAAYDCVCDISAHGIDKLRLFDTFEAGLVSDLFLMHHFIMETEAEFAVRKAVRQRQKVFRPVKNMDQTIWCPIPVHRCGNACHDILDIDTLCFSGNSYITHIIPDLFIRQAGVLHAEDCYILVLGQVGQNTFNIHLYRTTGHRRHWKLFSTDEGNLQINHSFWSKASELLPWMIPARISSLFRMP